MRSWQRADGVARESEGSAGLPLSYALYDKISRDDILAHAYAQCRSNQGARAVNGQDFEAVEGYGVERWLGELALALREETYRPEPIRRVFIPKANGKFRPLGISTVHSPRDQTVESPWRLSFPNGIGACRGFLPRGLCDGCPRSVITSSHACASGQASHNP